MNFFKSVFADDPEPASDPPHSAAHPDPGDDEPNHRNPNPNAAWSFGGLIKTLASKSESVIESYRRDIEEFGTGLKKETAVIRDVASRAVKDLPASLEVGASVAQDSLESVGQAIDDIGSSVWRGTAEIITHGRDALLAAEEHDIDSPSDSSSQQLSSQSLSSQRYSRFDVQLRAIQCDENTYREEPEDLDGFSKWKLGFVLEDKSAEIENLSEANGVMGEIYSKVVPNVVDHDTFWSRYFYRIHKLKLVEDARVNLVNRAIAGDEEEDLSWDIDDDEDDEEKSNGSELKRELNKENYSESVMEQKIVENSQLEESLKKGVVHEQAPDERVNSDGRSDSDKSETKSEKMISEGRTDSVSIVSSPPSLPEEEDLGWDEIEDIGSIDENKVGVSGSPANKADLRKRLSAAEEDEDLTWDIEDDDEPAKS
ncbi:BSD domain-containing protein 1 [Vitis vinifera]|uniref:BSD domain-containing protein 1 n=1 Tax=Vitis vinifera TaxID=29760 RepID=A0A438F608_VITVI|nr:BSD domain-containing protein 1 [Vitis vinifera]RVX21727.1 BSD domain-containing protein 1 [Vitis vinifera]